MSNTTPICRFTKREMMTPPNVLDRENGEEVSCSSLASRSMTSSKVLSPSTPRNGFNGVPFGFGSACGSTSSGCDS